MIFIRSKIKTYLTVFFIILFILSFTNSADAALTWGNEGVFNTQTSYFEAVAGISSELFVAAYQDYESSLFYGKAIRGSISGDNISYSSEYTFNSANTTQIQISRLTVDTFVIVYVDVGNSNYGTAIIGTLGRSNIVFGSEYVFNTATNYPHVDRLDDTKFVVTFSDASGDGGARIGDVSGSGSGATITWGGSEGFQKGSANYDSVAALVEDSTPYKFVAAYQDNSSGDGKAIVGTVSGNTISFSGSVATFDTGSATAVEVDALTDSKFVVSYQDANTSQYGFSIIGDVSGSSISYGSRYEFNNARSEYIDVVGLGSNTFTTAYQDQGNSSRGTAITGTVTGNVISYGSESVYNTGTTYYNSTSYLPDSASDFVVGYQDRSNSYYGTALIGNEDSGGGPSTVPEFPSWLIKILIGSFGFVVVLFIGIYIKKKITNLKKN